MIPHHYTELEAYKAALDAHAIVAITDTHGKIIYANDKFCAISKYPREELLGKDHRIINSGHHPKEFIADLWRTIKSGRIWKGELRNRAKDGTLYWVDTTIVPFLDASGTPVQFIAIRAEITDRKRLEDANAATVRELREVNRELTDFAYVVSHDLKAPLRGISSLASWLMTDYGDKLGAEGTEQLRLLSSRVTRLGGLIDGILAYSRVGRAVEHRVPVELDQIARNAADLLAPPTHITVEFATPLPSVVIDPAKAQQIFQNLLSNAIKFMDKAAGRVVVACTREDDHWHFTVADNGPGIDAVYFERIFQLFQTLASRDRVEGTGVGLALVKRIVERERGRIWVESTLGAGTTFHFTLPLQESQSITVEGNAL